ncbi:hypothetical protein Cfor_09111, partial [Coptotermes formosanus]
RCGWQASCGLLARSRGAAIAGYRGCLSAPCPRVGITIARPRDVELGTTDFQQKTTSAVAGCLCVAAASTQPQRGYERDVEHELLGLPPRSRLKRGAVPDRAVPISLPSLIGKWKQPRQRQQQVNTSKRGGRKPRTPLCEDEDAAVAENRDVTTRFDILLALGLKPINKNHQDGDDYRY